MNRRPNPFALAAIVATIAILVPTPATAQKIADPRDAPYAQPDDLMPVDPSIIIGQLDNGLRYFIRENPWPEGRAELRLVVKGEDAEEALAAVMELVDQKFYED